MSTSSTPMFCLLVKAPISSQIKTTRVNGHYTSGSLCSRRLLYSRSFNPVRAALSIPVGSKPRRECDRPGGLVVFLWPLIPPRSTVQLVLRQKTAVGVPLKADKRSHGAPQSHNRAKRNLRPLLHFTGEYVAQNGDVLVNIPRSAGCWSYIPRCFSLLEPVKEVCGSTWRQSGTNPGRGFCAVLLSPAAASADPLCNVTFLRQMCE